MRILWSMVIGVLTLSLLLAGGLGALQSAVVITGLPFSIVLFFMIAGLHKALKMEAIKEDSRLLSLSGHLSGRTGGERGKRDNWQHRLRRAMSFPNEKQAKRFMNETCLPALEAVRDSLSEQGVEVEVNQGVQNGYDYMSLNVDLQDEQNFTYQVWSQASPRQASPCIPLRRANATIGSRFI